MGLRCLKLKTGMMWWVEGGGEGREGSGHETGMVGNKEWEGGVGGDSFCVMWCL